MLKTPTANFKRVCVLLRLSFAKHLHKKAKYQNYTNRHNLLPARPSTPSLSPKPEYPSPLKTSMPFLIEFKHLTTNCPLFLANMPLLSNANSFRQSFRCERKTFLQSSGEKRHTKENNNNECHSKTSLISGSFSFLLISFSPRKTSSHLPTLCCRVCNKRKVDKKSLFDPIFCIVNTRLGHLGLLRRHFVSLISC